MESPDSQHEVQVQLEKEVWETNGCSEFLQSLQFEAVKPDPSSLWLTLTAPPTLLERKTLHNAATAILAVFGKC